MAGVDPPLAPPRPIGSHPLVKAAAAAVILALGAFIAVQGKTLYDEFRQLREQQGRTSLSAVVGYPEIFSAPSYATKPDNWFHEEGNETLLWAGWKDGRHEWFRIGLGDLTREQMSLPMGRDIIRAIDHPVVEHDGDARWRRIPDAALVAGLEHQGVRAAYPLVVLAKVEVVNDLIAEKPLLMVFRPFTPDYEAVAAYDPTIDGERITMGLSGYLIEQKPVLYDRKTRSLWTEREGAMLAVAGPRKGVKLRPVDGVEVRPWSVWRSRYPESRLVVGADRSKGTPGL